MHFVVVVAALAGVVGVVVVVVLKCEVIVFVRARFRAVLSMNF